MKEICEVALSPHICNHKVLGVIIQNWNTREQLCFLWKPNKAYNSLNLDFLKENILCIGGITVFFWTRRYSLTQLQQKELNAEYHHCTKSSFPVSKDELSSVILFLYCKTLKIVSQAYIKYTKVFCMLLENSLKNKTLALRCNIQLPMHKILWS